MGNATTLATLEYEMAYNPDGMQDAVRRLRADAARHFPADNLALAKISTSAITDVKTSATQVVALIIKTNAAATTSGWVHMYNTSSASVTVGTTVVDQTIKLSNAANVLKVVRFYPGSGATEFALALSIATVISAVATNTTAANATNAPTITVLYA